MSLPKSAGEPSSGTDTSSIKTFARRDGDHYVVNGQKTAVVILRREAPGGATATLAALRQNAKSPAAVRPGTPVRRRMSTSS